MVVNMEDLGSDNSSVAKDLINEKKAS